MTLAQSVAVRLDADIKDLTKQAETTRVFASGIGYPLAEAYFTRSKYYARAAAELRGVARDLGASSEATVTWPVPVLTKEKVREALEHAAPGANELNRQLKSVFCLPNSNLRLRGSR